MLESYNQLLMQLIDRSNEDILVTSVDHRKSSTAISEPPAIHYPMNSSCCVSGILLKKMQTPFRVSRHMNGSGKQKIPFTAFTASRQV